MNIAQIVKYKNKQPFYDGAQTDILNTKTHHDRTQNRYTKFKN